MPINTKIEGDPESIRSAATWLRATFSGAVYDSVTQIHHARGNSESFWEGDAGEGFRTKMTAAGKNGDAMADGADQAGQAFEGYAADLQTGQIGMERARQVALDGGLEVSGDKILNPGPRRGMVALTPAGVYHRSGEFHNFVAWDSVVRIQAGELERPPDPGQSRGQRAALAPADIPPAHAAGAQARSRHCREGPMAIYRSCSTLLRAALLP